MRSFKESLIADLKPIERIKSPAKQFITFLLVALLIIIMLILVMQPRENNLSFYTRTSYLFELLLIIATMALVGVSTLRLSIPGYSTGKVEKSLILISYLMWPVFVFVTYPEVNETFKDPDYYCLIILSLISVVVAFVFFRQILKRAPTTPIWVGLGSTLICTITGALALQFICPKISFFHVFFWHVLPVILIPIVLIGLYKKIFKW